MAEPPSFVSTEYPYLPVDFTIGLLQARALAYIDTGFDGYLVIPEALGWQLPLPEQLQRLGLASGAMVRAPVYLGSLETPGFAPPFPARIVLLGDEYILGRRGIDRHAVLFDHGRRVEVRE